MRYIATAALADWLEENERSLAWLARRVGCSHQLIWFLLRGERTAGEELAARIAETCGLSVSILFLPASSLVDTREGVMV